MAGALLAGGLTACTAAEPASPSGSTMTSRPVSSGAPATSAATSPPATDSTSGTTEPVLTPEQREVADAYRAALDAFNEAYRDPMRPDLPALRETMTGIMLSDTVAAIEKDLADGVTTRPGDRNLFAARVEAVRITGDTAEVDACVIDDVVLVEKATGTVVDDAVRVVTETATLARSDKRWRMSARAVHSESEADSCEAS